LVMLLVMIYARDIVRNDGRRSGHSSAPL